MKIELFKIDVSINTLIPFADEGIRAGFPSPAQDFMEMAIDLNKELIKHPASTFIGRVRGNSMVEANLEDGDLLVIDKAADIISGKIAVCYLDGDFTIKYIEITKEVIWLHPANHEYPSIKVTADNNLIIWGIVEYIIKKPKLKTDFNEL